MMVSHARGLMLAASGALVMAVWSPASSAGEVARFQHEAAQSFAVTLPGMGEGAWRTRTQLVWDNSAQELKRRSLTFWDPLAANGYEFVWTPDASGALPSGEIGGRGRIEWRAGGAPSYARTGAIAEYRGSMQNGRADGSGTYAHVSGVTYAGTWKGGLMEGQGRLSFANGDQYVGGFRAGRLHGEGEYVDATGLIYRGAFVDGVRQGEGLVLRPDGYAYSAVWHGGSEVAGTQAVASAAGSKATVFPVQYDEVEGLRIGVLVDQRQLGEYDPVIRVPYVAEGDGEVLRIFPGDERVMSVWKGEGELQLTNDEAFDYENYGGSFLGARARYEPVPIIFEVQNDTADDARIVGAYMEVAASRSELDPAVQLVTESGEYCDPDNIAFMPRFTLENYGWSDATNARASVAFGDGTGLAPIEKPVSDITDEVTVDLAEDIQALDVDTGLLSTTQVSCSVNPEPFYDMEPGAPDPVEICLQEARDSGAFGELAPYLSVRSIWIGTDVAGTLAYDWQDVDGNMQSRQSPFSTWLSLATIEFEVECGEGGAPEDLQADTFVFDLDRQDYRIDMALDDAVAPGETARWRVFIEAPKSSLHDFRIVLQLADGSRIASRPISFLYFTPSR